MLRNTSFSSNTSFNEKIFVCEYLKIRIIVVTGKLHMISLMFKKRQKWNANVKQDG